MEVYKVNEQTAKRKWGSNNPPEALWSDYNYIKIENGKICSIAEGTHYAGCSCKGIGDKNKNCKLCINRIFDALSDNDKEKCKKLVKKFVELQKAQKLISSNATQFEFVIKCRECKHSKIFNDNIHYACMKRSRVSNSSPDRDRYEIHLGDFYCADAERNGA